MRLLTAILVAAAVSLAGGQAAAEGSRLVQFRLPSGNIGCSGSTGANAQPRYLRCDILSGLRPEPRRACELDWTGFSMRPTGRAGAVCAGDTAYDKGARILRYGTTWKQDGFVCRSRRSGLRCSNRDGHGFVLARARSYTY